MTIPVKNGQWHCARHEMELPAHLHGDKSLQAEKNPQGIVANFNGHVEA